jgi:hypothetical protein
VLVPGAHVMIATNPLVSHHVYVPFQAAGFEKRGEIIRIVHTLRGGDRPKNAHREFNSVTVMPKSCWEPWGLFRKPCEGRVRDNLRKWKTGGVILDPFMGSGATVAAASACGLQSIGLEIDAEYFEMAERAIPKLNRLRVDEANGNGTP